MKVLLVQADFRDFSSLNIDADVGSWCLGVTSGGLSEADADNNQAVG